MKLFLSITLMMTAYTSLCFADSLSGSTKTVEADCSASNQNSHVERAKCIAMRACLKCSEVAIPQDLHFGVSENQIDQISIPNSKIAKFGQFEVRGGFSIGVMQNRYGTIVCPTSNSSKIFVREIPLEGCFKLLDGRPMPVDLPYPLNEPRFVKSIIVTGLQKNPADFNRLATGVVVLQKKMSICGVGLPAKTELSFSSMIKEMELEATPPNGSVVHGKRFPLAEEKLMLTDGTKCNVRFENRAMDE